MTGKVGNGQVVFAGMGLNFTEPKGLYDATAYKGLSFSEERPERARYASKYRTSRRIRRQVRTNECYNDFGADIELTDQWAIYAFRLRR
jgi:endoglucanase